MFVRLLPLVRYIVTYIYRCISILFSRLLSPLVLRTRSRPQNAEFGPVHLCDHSSVISPRRPRRVYNVFGFCHEFKVLPDFRYTHKSLSNGNGNKFRLTTLHVNSGK
jgi:hypothetical protein